MKRLHSAVAVLLTIVAVAAIGSPAFAQNLLTNPGFEDGWNGWFTFGNGPNLSTPSTDNIARTDTVAAKIFGEGICGTYGSPGGFGQAFTPTTGKIYQLNGYYFVSSGDPLPDSTDTCNSNRLIAQIAFFDAASAGAVIARNEVVIGDGTTVQDEWHYFTVELPAPLGALRVETLFLFLQPDCDPGSVFVDDVEFYELDPPVPGSNLLANPSFDTGLTDWFTFGKVFAESRAVGVRTPPGSAKLFGAFNPPDDSGMYQKFAASADTDYELETYTLNTCGDFDPITGTNDNYVISKIVFYDGTGTEIYAEEDTILDSSSPLGTWTHHSFTATSPAGTDSVSAYILFIQPSNLGGAMFLDDVAFREKEATGIADVPAAADFVLYQNVPNPFNPTTRIDFELTRPDYVDISVYDVAGRLVTTLFRGELQTGPNHVTWNGRAADGSVAATGVYWYTMKTSTGQISRKMVLIK